MKGLFVQDPHTWNSYDQTHLPSSVPVKATDPCLIFYLSSIHDIDLLLFTDQQVCLVLCETSVSR